jgi:ArsR family transcriptional regulator
VALVLATDFKNQVGTRRWKLQSPRPPLRLSLSINIDAGSSLPAWIDNRQDRGMSIQAERSPAAFIPAAELRVVVDACSAPLVGEPLSQSAAAGLAQVFKALGDPVRLRLVSLIGAHQGGEVCVCDLTAAFDLTQPTISHHLKVLREAGIIDSQRRGTWVHYWLVPTALERMSALLSPPAR